LTQTRIFNRLPNIAGVHFDGFEGFKIKSREIVKESIEDFLKYCREEARGTAARIILGEWGEGKTEAYYRYIKPFAEDNGDYALFISASTLANCYEDEKTRKLMDTSPLTPLKLLTALFCGIKKEAEDIYKTLIPSLDGFNDAEEYIEETLKNMLGNYKEKRQIFIFVDEFEELLLNKDTLKGIISGIKETINGRYGLIHENGKYEGSVHFLISCTPDAYYKLQVHKDTSLIFGGLGRRVNVITLPEIRKKEGIEFLFALLNYSYNGMLPEPLPIENLGVLALLLRISQGNLGVLTNLLTGVLNRARKDEHLEVLNFENMLSFLESEQIFVFGGQTPCIEIETYSKILKLLKDQKNKEIGERTEKIFKLLIGELKPFSIDELEKRTNSRKQYIQQSINIINDQIRTKEKIEKTILKVALLKEDKTFDDVLKAFDEYIYKDQERNEKRVEIENYSELLEDFEDKITHYFFDGQDIKSQIFLPYEDIDIRVFFEGISQDKAREISNMVKRKLCDAEPYYLAGEEILRQIFPTPVPKGLEFIGNREVRMKLWREVSKNLADQYDKYMPEAFLTILKEADIFEIIGKNNFGNYSIVKMKDKTDTTINALFYSINGDVKSQDIEEINSLLKGIKPPIHLAIVIFTGDITLSAQDKILNKELGEEGENLILNLHLHPTLAKRIICAHRSTIEARENVDFESFKAISKEIISSDLLFERRIFEWIKTQEEKGVVIGQIVTSTTLKEFSDSLKFYLNFIDEENTPEEIYDKNVNRILKFRKYGSKAGFLPSDIESLTKMRDLSYDLLNNQFLERRNDKYKVVIHPVEKRVLKILEREEKITENDLKNYFIIKSKTGRPLENVFLNILEYKGMIKKEGKFYTLIEPNEFYEELKREYEKYKRSIEREEFKKYGHFYVVKEREENLIILQEFDKFITSIFERIESVRYLSEKEDVFLQQISLVKRLLKEFISEFEPAIREAYKRGKEISEEVRGKFVEIETELREIIKNSKKWLGFDFELESLKEYKDIHTIVNRIKELHAKDYPVNELKEFIDGLDKEKKKVFKFGRSPEDTSYFNIKLFQLEGYKEELEEKIKNNLKIVKRIDELFDELNKKERDLKSKLGVKEIPDEYKISKGVLDYLESYQIIIEKTKLNYKESGINLRDIESAAKGTHESIIERLNELIDCVYILDDIITKEKHFLFDLKNSKQFKEKIKKIFDIGEFSGYISDFEKKLDEIEEGYGNKNKIFELLKGKNLKKCLKDLEKIIDDWINSIKNSILELEKAWREYIEKTTKFEKRIKELLKLISEKHQANTDEIKIKIEKLRKNIKSDIHEQEEKLSILEDIKREIREKTYELMTKFLSKEEIIVLDVLFSKYDEGAEWITLDVIKREASEKHSLNQTQVNHALNGLISKGYLRPGFSLVL